MANFGAIRLSICFCWMLFQCSGATAATELIFAQIADGGGYRTTLLLTNPTSIATTATIAFTGNSGLPMVVSSGGSAAGSFSVDLPAGGAFRFQTGGEAPDASVGWARVTTAPPVDINGTAVFQLFNGTALMCEASVMASAPSAGVDFFVDEDGGVNTAFAMANAGAVAAVGTIRLRGMDGVEFASGAIRLEPGEHTAAYVYQLIPEARSGRAEIRLDFGALAVTALRYHSGLFSALPAEPLSFESQSVLFSPNGGVRARIVSEIGKAQSTIDVAIYSFTSYEIEAALVAARSRGVAIRIVTDSSQAAGQGSQIPVLEQAGFSVKRLTGLGNGIMHDKYMIIDGSTLLTGSYNWSVSAESYNFENAIFLRGSGVVRDYISDFGKLWQLK